jgi:hypothetical protein
MANRTIMASMFVLLCLATVSTSCKKGCPACRSYGSNSTSYLQPYSSQVCYNNFCTCPNGLEGDSCQTYSINKYFQPSSTWQVTDACSGSSTYYVSISTSATLPYTQIYISNLFDVGSFIEADIASTPNNTNTQLIIPSQNTPNGSINSGIGYYSLNGPVGKITLNLDYTNSAGLEFPCTLYLYQQ